MLPVVYFGFAYVSLAVAMASLLWDPRAVAGFFYHARIVAIVHLVTLGWITSSILGALYIVGPLAMRMPLPARWGDYLACGAYIIGVAGMIAHFGIEQFSGMAWSGIMVAGAVAWVGARVAANVWRAPIQRAVRVHVTLAFVNILLAATAGILLGFDKSRHFLPGFSLSNVVAHAHLAAVGWACMMVVGVAYRLLPMLLPAAMPSGWSLFLSAAFLEAGVLGLFAALVGRHWSVPIWASIIVLGFLAFGAQAGWMLANRRRPHPGIPTPDYGVRHAALAMASLACAVVLGLALAFLPMTDWTLRAALAYGVFGLVGFLSQMVVAMQTRLLPLFAWHAAAARTPTALWGSLTPPYAMATGVWRVVQHAVWLLWAVGVPMLAAGFAMDHVPLLVAAAAALGAATMGGAAVSCAVLRHVSCRTQRSPGTRVLEHGDHKVHGELTAPGR
jgi:hypothetical protein